MKTKKSRETKNRQGSRWQANRITFIQNTTAKGIFPEIPLQEIDSPQEWLSVASTFVDV
jgi:hypothetical protein